MDVVENGQYDNRSAMPPPVESNRPGPSDWVSKNGSVFDGDYITIRNNAWGGTTMKHSWNGTSPGGIEVTADKLKNAGSGGPPHLPLSKVRMDNKYTWCIRRVVFDNDKKAWVLPSWTAWKDRSPISMSDRVVFLCPNDPDLVLGTKSPGTYGNNGDYRCELVKFPLATKDQLVGSGVTGHLSRIVSLGFWRDDKKNVDFLNQSRCVWTFHSPAGGGQGSVKYGSSPLNIRNMWTEIKSKETGIWDAIGGAQVSLINYAVVSTFNGGRNLTQASGSGGSVVKLALTNKDRDDKAMWIIDGWYGNRYPVQRAVIPSHPPPPADIEEEEDDPTRPMRRPDPPTWIPDLHEQIKNPPPIIPGLTLDDKTGTNKHSGLEDSTRSQNPFSLLDYISNAVFGSRWSEISYLQQITMVGLIALGVIVIADDIIKALVNKII